MAPVHKSLEGFAEHTIIHTDQHYDYKLSKIFFSEFNLPEPHFNLEVGSGPPGYQIGEMIKRLQKIFLQNAGSLKSRNKNGKNCEGHKRFDIVLVYGDTNSTFASDYLFASTSN
jgi:UDP-N-acetylglucosamine 2-epimerase